MIHATEALKLTESYDYRPLEEILELADKEIRKVAIKGEREISITLANASEPFTQKVCNAFSSNGYQVKYWGGVRERWNICVKW